MPIGTGVRPGENVKLTSWKSPSDPSPGRYSAGFGTLTLPEIFIWDNDTTVWRSGPWNGQRFIGSRDVESADLSMYELTFSNDNQGSVSLSFDNDTLMYHFVLDSQGTLLQRSWSSANQDWTVGYNVPSTKCDVYGKCGQFASCNPRKNPLCECIQGFEPKNDTEWNKGDWTNGCKRRVPLQCERENSNGGRGGGGEGDGFLRLRKTKVPFSPQRSEGNENECRRSCLQNCSCTAYAYDTGLRCFLWSGSLLDMQKFSRNGVDLYVRLAGSEFGKYIYNSHSFHSFRYAFSLRSIWVSFFLLKSLADTPNSRPIIISIPVIGAAFILAVCILLALRQITGRRENERNAKLLFERMVALTSGDLTGSN
ncbi:PREDICTED: G-type lectin S-receptor-like serine/threonine-protein kinase SD1-13 [Tarenaya hassleriana]|uniref:G-type lectin S-receptor-like serine/threonine-protein kinase SD1-13 n=1 Tax=Tarenaya hassleriana TaxID=28532 RepID=UPI0008FD0962|nr:PREDICTED: G-type lectin S-receptor-like serine/threonine-protein kinase SD1-13 [Tarenaya hassleriana]